MPNAKLRDALYALFGSLIAIGQIMGFYNESIASELLTIAGSVATFVLLGFNMPSKVEARHAKK